MGPLFEELDRRSTPMGEISLRRRVEQSLGVDVYEVKLDDEFLMSSLFTAGEIALARLTLAEVDGTALEVVVGGLGLGCTARAALEDQRVSALHVVEASDAVIDWHRRGLVPDGATLAPDPRCRFVNGDFFAMASAAADHADGLPPLFHAVLLDIDHSPARHLHPDHAPFYGRPGLRHLASRLHPGGAFGLWSDDPPDDEFVGELADVFDRVEAHVVAFPNFYTDAESTNTVYVATVTA